MRRLRPLYNLGARLLGAQPLPSPGGQLRAAYASFVCIRDDDPVVFGDLLERVYHLAARRGYAYLLVGLAARDPLLPVARRYPHIGYHSRLYTVCWPDGEDLHARLDGRVPYVDIATL